LRFTLDFIKLVAFERRSLASIDAVSIRAAAPSGAARAVAADASRAGPSILRRRIQASVRLARIIRAFLTVITIARLTALLRQRRAVGRAWNRARVGAHPFTRGAAVGRTRDGFAPDTIKIFVYMAVAIIVHAVASFGRRGA